MMIGSRDLLKKYGTRLKVAEALLLGNITSYEEEFLLELVNPVILEAAKIRLETERNFWQYFLT